MKRSYILSAITAIAVVLIAGFFVLQILEENQTGTEPTPSGPTQQSVMLEPSVSYLDTSGSTPQKVSTLVGGANQFAFDTYSRLAGDNGNTFFSPYSIHTALSMTYEGARGETAAEMEEVLNLPEKDGVRRPAFADFQKKLVTDRTVKLEVANALWPQENYPFYENYLETVRKYYLAGIESLDYVNNPNAAVERINNWAAEHTENRIKRIIGSLPPLTRLVLTNAIYFRGDWLVPFDESRTENETFHLPNGETIQTPMMQFNENRIGENKFCYSETPEIKALKLPYSGRGMSMIFLLSKDGSEGIEWLRKNVDESQLKTIQNNFENRRMGKIKIPKFEFKVRYQEEMKRALKGMGMHSAFDLETADFTDMEGAPNEDLYISDVIHKAYIKVNEEGTEAAAVTAVVMPTSGVGTEPPTFVADHPFMFLIKDEKTGSILFMGSVMNPQAD